MQKNLTGMNFDRVYTSPLTSRRRLAAYCGYPHAIPDSRLKEMNFGEWEMQAWETIRDPHLQTGLKTGFTSLLQRARASRTNPLPPPSSTRCAACPPGTSEVSPISTIACAQIYAGTDNLGDAFASDIPFMAAP